MPDNTISRSAVISLLAGLPLVAATGSIALAADDSSGTKAQFKYQTKPGPGGKDCAACSFFKAPGACQIVKGKISPKGYCISFAPKAK
jgi:hypothetical protein